MTHQTNPHQPLDCKASWLACLCSSLASFICVGTTYVYGIFFPKLLQEFQAGKAKTAIPGSCSVAFLTILCPVASVFCIRFGSRIAIPCGAIICAIGLVGSSFAPNIYVLSITYGFIAAWGSCLIYMAGFLMVPLYFDKHRSLATAMVSAGPGAGVLIMSPLTQTFIEHLNWRTTMLVLAAVNLATAILGAGVTRKVQPDSQDKHHGRRRKKTLGTVLSFMNLSVLRNPMMILVLTMSVVIVLAHFMPLVHLIKYAEELKIPSHRSSWMYPIAGIVSTVSRVVTGKIGDSGRISFYYIFQTGLALIIVTDFLVPMARKVEYLYVYAVMQGLCEGMYFTPVYCLVMAISPQHGIGWLMLMVGIPIFVSAPIAGLIADSSQSYAPVFYTAGGLNILAFLIPYIRHCIKQPETLRSEVLVTDSMTLLVVERETVV